MACGPEKPAQRDSEATLDPKGRLWPTTDAWGGGVGVASRQTLLAPIVLTYASNALKKQHVKRCATRPKAPIPKTRTNPTPRTPFGCHGDRGTGA